MTPVSKPLSPIGTPLSPHSRALIELERPRCAAEATMMTVQGRDDVRH